MRVKNLAGETAEVQGYITKEGRNCAIVVNGNKLESWPFYRLIVLEETQKKNK